MTFSSEQWPLLGSFLEAMAIASVPGILIYAFIRYLCEKSPQRVLLVFAFFAAFIGFFGLVALADKSVFVAASLVVWIGATFTDRAAQPSEARWFETFFKIAVATLCSAFSSYLFWLSVVCFLPLKPLFSDFLLWMAGFPPQSSLFSEQADWFFNGFLVGGLVAPAAISIFFYVWKNSKLRPGIDRHLKQGDDLH